jgi:hypothetical protein
MWLDFEVRMRSLMKNVISPVIDLTTEDREAFFDLDQRHEAALDRIDKLEEAVFRTYETKGRTIFHEYDEKLS